VLPAPAAVPVDRFVGIGLVGPLTERPVSGVCARSRSRPVPPALGLVEPVLSLVEGPVLSLIEGARPIGFFGFCARRVAGRAAAGFFARAPAVRRSCNGRVFFRLKALAAAACREPGRTACRERGRTVFRPALRRAGVVRLDRRLRADAPAPDPARLFDGVLFCPLLEPLRADPAAFRFAAFLAMVLDPCFTRARGASPRDPCN
jgi:hypothetical protein